MNVAKYKSHIAHAIWGFIIGTVMIAVLLIYDLPDSAVFTITAGALAGLLAHEPAHYVGWKMAGRQPELDWKKLEVRPTTGPKHTTPTDRLAAAAPYLLGITAIIVSVIFSNWPGIFFGLLIIHLPSVSDLGAIAGIVEWNLPAD